MKSYSVTIQMKTSLAVFSYGPVYFVNNINFWEFSFWEFLGVNNIN